MNVFYKRSSNSFYTENDKNEIILDIESQFGSCMTILHEIVSDDIHIDIAVIPPTKEMDFYKLFTIGMGSREMNTPKKLKQQKLQRAELAMFISNDWNINTDDVKYHWTIDLLKTRLSEAEDVKNELSPIIEKYLKQGLTFEEITRMFVEIMRENRIKI